MLALALIGLEVLSLFQLACSLLLRWSVFFDFA